MYSKIPGYKRTIEVTLIEGNRLKRQVVPDAVLIRNDSGEIIGVGTRKPLPDSSRGFANLEIVYRKK